MGDEKIKRRKMMREKRKPMYMDIDEGCEAWGITEKLKAKDMMKWVGLMYNKTIEI